MTVGITSEFVLKIRDFSVFGQFPDQASNFHIILFDNMYYIEKYISLH